MNDISLEQRFNKLFSNPEAVIENEGYVESHRDELDRIFNARDTSIPASDISIVDAVEANDPIIGQVNSKINTLAATVIKALIIK